MKEYDLNTITTPIKDIKEYSNDELKNLYKSYGLYLVTEYFRNVRKYKKEQKNSPIVFVNIMDIYTDFSKVNVITLNTSTIKMKYDNMLNVTDESKEEYKAIKDTHTAISICDKSMFWCRDNFHDEVEQAVDNYDENNDIEAGRVEWYEELHMNDETDKYMNRATQYEIYKFIWETLRFCDIKTLNVLIKLADKRFIVHKPHRPANNKHIYKYDKKGNLMGMYENREQCIKQEGITKYALSMILTGKRKTLNGYIYVEAE